jgi:hypothetical protein
LALHRSRPKLEFQRRHSMSRYIVLRKYFHLSTYKIRPSAQPNIIFALKWAPNLNRHCPKGMFVTKNEQPDWVGSGNFDNIRSTKYHFYKMKCVAPTTVFLQHVVRKKLWFSTSKHSAQKTVFRPLEFDFFYLKVRAFVFLSIFWQLWRLAEISQV